MVILSALSALADTYPTEVWPDSTTLLALDGANDNETGIPHVAKGTRPTDSPSLELWVRRQWDRLATIVTASAELRVVETDDLKVGVFPGLFALRGTSYEYDGQTDQTGADGVAFSDGDDTYYLWLDSTNALRMATDATGWPAVKTTYIPLAEVTVTGSVIATIVDARNRSRLATWQTWDTDLDDIAALTHMNGTIIGSDGYNWGSYTNAQARTFLGVEIGTHVQAWDDDLDDIAALTPTDSYIMVGDGTNWVTESGATARSSLEAQEADNDLTDIAALVPNDSYIMVGNSEDWVTETGATARTSLGLGTMATQAANNVSISGGSISGITDLAIADGGTGAGTASAARTALGVAIGSDAQAWDDDLDDIAALTPTDSYIMVGDGTDWVTETTTTARTSLGLGTMATQAANNVSISGGSISGITDLAIADGGTGAGTASAARTALGVAIGSDVQAYDAELAAVAGLSGTGLVAHTGAGAMTERTVTAGAGIAITNGNGVAGNPTVARNTTVEHHTSNDTLAASESFKLLTNSGATSMVVLTLPTAAAGLTFDFVVMDTDGLRITAAGGNYIRLAGSGTSGGGYIESTTHGDAVTLVALNASYWFATSYIGTWSTGP